MNNATRPLVSALSWIFLSGCTAAAFPAGVDYENAGSGGSAGSTTTSPARVVFTSVSAGYHSACALKSDGTMACWPGNWGLPGTFKALSVGGSWPCAVRTDGTVICWTASGPIPRSGEDGGADGGTAMVSFQYPTGTFASLSVGYARACGVKDDGTVACWGALAPNQDPPPDGVFVSVAVESYAYGLRQDGTVASWNPYGSAPGYSNPAAPVPPAGAYTSVSAGVSFSCGVKIDGTLACWGDLSAAANPPVGTFTSVSSGNGYACGLGTDGKVTCWGDNSFGRAKPPSDTFVSIDAGYEFACGVKTDGTIACWGDNSVGELSPPAP